jgi:iron complex outermembrane receptor protein
LQYKITPDVMAYGTYSEGVNPGAFNSSFLTLPSETLSALRTLGFGAAVAVQPEKITNYELGIKGRFLDGRATLSADVYVDKWTNQIDGETYTFGAADPNNPYNLKDSLTYKPGGNTSINVLTFYDNGAASIYKGVEVEGTLIPIDHLTVNASAAYSDAKYDKFTCSSCLPFPQSPGYNAAGNSPPYVPKVSATVGAQYGRSTDFFGGPADWSVRVDYVYREGVYIQATNTVKTPDINLVNLKANLNFGHFGVDAYVNNLTNNKAYTSGFEAANFTNFTSYSALVSLPQLITVGVDLKYHF